MGKIEDVDECVRFDGTESSNQLWIDPHRPED